MGFRIPGIGGIVAAMQRPTSVLILTFLQVALVSAVLVLAVISVCAALGTWISTLSFFQAFAMQVGGLAAICVPLALAMRLRYYALISAAMTIWQGSLLLPFLEMEADRRPAGEPLHALSINLWRSNPEPQIAIDYLRGSGADVVAAVEATPEWRRRLTVLKDLYPYQVDCTDSPVPCWAAVYSKRPILRASADTIDHGSPIIVWAEIEWQGKPLTIAAVQIFNPMADLVHGRHKQQGANLSRYASAIPGDAVLMGDFNSAPWGTLQTEFREKTGFDNRGRLALTWPAWVPAFSRLPLDQIFVRGALEIRNYRAGPLVGSDHLPVLAEVYRTSP